MIGGASGFGSETTDMIDSELFGGGRGLLEHVRARTLYALGAYRESRDIDWSAVRRLVFVCKGNICRSPYACMKARTLGAPAASFGLEATPGRPADPAALKNALPRGIDLSAHRSMRVEPAFIASGDLVLVFEPSQLSEVTRMSARQTSFVSLLGIWTSPERPHIQDPYGRRDRYFQQCFAVIDENVTEIARRLSRCGIPSGQPNSHGQSIAATLSHRTVG